MNIKLKLIGIIIIFGIIAIIGANLENTALFSYSPDQNIKIGLMMPLSGDASSWGLEAKTGADLAIKELNKEGINIEFIFEDDKCDPKEGINAFNKLTNIDNIKITGGTICSSVALAIADQLTKKNILHLSTGASNPQIRNSGDYILSLWPLDDADGQAIANYAITKAHKNKFAILYINNDYGVGLKDAFSKTLKENNKELKFNESFSANTKDVRIQLTKIKQLDIDAVYIATNPAELITILNQIKEIGLNIQLFVNGAAVESKEILENKEIDLNEIIYSIPKRNLNNEFIIKYQEEYGVNPSFVADAGYDTVMLLAQGTQICGNDSSCIRDYLWNLKNYQGAGDIINFNNGEIKNEFEIKQIQNNKLVILN